MSKQDNLTDFLTDVADAIREKKGTTEKINPQNFSDEIRSIEGGIPTAEWNDVNFYDYEGTILYSYTWDEFVAKNEMPPLPTHHEGLTCQEWNYTLEEVLEQGGRCDVGAIYIPTDGKNKIIVDASIHKKISLYISVSGSVLEAHIDWGDGNVEMITSTQTITHEYDADDVYTINVWGSTYNITIGREYAFNVIRIHTNDKTRLTAGYTSCKHISLGHEYGGEVLNTKLRHINISRKQTTINPNTFNTSASLFSISIPNTITKITSILDAQHFFHLHIPTNTSSVTISTTQYKHGFETISVSKANTYYEVQGNCLIENSTKKILTGINIANIPDGVLEIGDYAFQGCVLYNIIIPNSVKVIGKQSFYSQDKGLMYSTAYMGKSVEQIKANAFGYTKVKEYYDFRAYEHIPSLENSNAFAGMQTTCKIVVPDALYDQWIAATNWSTYASKIIKASEYVEPTTE